VVLCEREGGIVCWRERDLGEGELHEREKRREGESELFVLKKD